jgi:predicted transcriptional regulator
MRQQKEGQMSNLVTKSVELIYQMDNDQLKQVAEAIQLKRQYLAKQAIKNFIKGDMVQFTNKTGGRVNATVEKVNKKYVIVSTHIGGEKWRVPATMLTKLSDIGVSA